MSSYIDSIGVAFLIFPLIAFLITVPYVIYQYHKYGAIPILRSLVIYSFILYLLCIYFLVILPLPSFEKVASLTTPYTQLIPFQFVTDFFKESGFIWNQVSTYFSAVKDPSFYNVFFNLLMFLPFGIYLRYYFQCGFWKTFFLSLGLSLFFELTQLSGLYGIYPRPYRLFDVDDLMINTLGGVAGFVMTPLLGFLPSRKRLDEVSYQRGQSVTFYRRFMALMLDWIFLGTVRSVCSLSSIPTLLLLLGYFILLPFLWNGQTIGKRIVRIQIIAENGNKAKISQYLVRYGLLYGAILYAPFWITWLMKLLPTLSFPFWIPCVIICFLLGFLYIRFLLETLRALLYSKKLFTYETMSKTNHKSTIKILKQEEN